MKLKIEIEAVPLGRPRVTVRGTYLPKRSQKFREEFQLLARAAFSRQAYTTPLKVILHFYKPRNPTARNFGDIDNLTKAVLDAGNGLIWKDDSLIVEMQAYKHKGVGRIDIEVLECTLT